MSDLKTGLSTFVPTVSAPARAAVYVRMSTEHQQYSIHNQMVANQAYAIAHGMEIVRIYSDEGISGLTIEGRAGLQRLMTDVRSGISDFDFILVYDVSRWGRFQDTDQGAHYEFDCRQNGVKVIYCAEPFENDNTPMTAVIKAVKRAMAAEYSRELGVKVFQGLCNLAGRGFDLGGCPPYGLIRLLVDANGNRLAVYTPGKHKAFSTDRLVLALGPPKEIKVVKEIFRRFVFLLENPGQIARHLNNHGLRTRSGRLWASTHVASILRNEKYIGTQTYNVRSSRLGTKAKRNHPGVWVRKPNAFPAIINPDLFRRAQKLLNRRTKRTNEELLAKLSQAIEKHGPLTYKAMRACRGLPKVGVYIWRFGNMTRAFQLAGVSGGTQKLWQGRYESMRLRQTILDAIVQRLESDGRSGRAEFRRAYVQIDNKWICRVHIVRRRTDRAFGARWCIGVREAPAADVFLLARQSVDRERFLDYYVIPEAMAFTLPTSLKMRNEASIDRFRVRDLAAAIERLMRLIPPKPTALRKIDH